MASILQSPWWSPDRAWGFRFSRVDLVILLTGGLTALAAAVYYPELAATVPFVVGHFFLFCNVFRVSRTLELAWAGLLFLNVGVWQLLGRFSWEAAIATQCVVTMIVIIRTLWSPNYHGIGCQRINPLGYRPGSRRH